MTLHDNPYQPPKSPPSFDEGKGPPAYPPKARPLFRIFSGIIGGLMIILGVGGLELSLEGAVFALVLMFAGLQFTAAAITGYWYSWFGWRR